MKLASAYIALKSVHDVTGGSFDVVERPCRPELKNKALWIRLLASASAQSGEAAKSSGEAPAWITRVFIAAPYKYFDNPMTGFVNRIVRAIKN